MCVCVCVCCVCVVEQPYRVSVILIKNLPICLANALFLLFCLPYYHGCGIAMGNFSTFLLVCGPIAVLPYDLLMMEGQRKYCELHSCLFNCADVKGMQVWGVNCIR